LQSHRTRIFQALQFFADNLQSIFAAAGWKADFMTLNVVLPVGISFYTFQSLSYTIDVYRGEIKPCRNLADFALYVSFFPQLVAGPIERAKNLLPQILAQRSVSPWQFREGVGLMMWGYFKKLVMADGLGSVADQVFSSGAALSGAEVLMGLYAFAFQIYGDFSGYSDIARGLGKVFGIELMANFRIPYAARDIQDFWRRWHISLSTWLRDYLYVPLGGSRKGNLNAARNVLLTMLLGGLWHGAAWTFVLWGFYHGLLLMGQRAFEGLARKAEKIAPALWGACSVAITFHLACLGWLLFRASSLSEAWRLASSLAGGFLEPTVLSITYGIQILFLGLLPFCAEVLAARSGKSAMDWPAPMRWALGILLAMRGPLLGMEASWRGYSRLQGRLKNHYHLVEMIRIQNERFGREKKDEKNDCLVVGSS
jgi:D-alanyl-lipoteichoic acid acyltransferase DltB (MBOAT superfamily)